MAISVNNPPVVQPQSQVQNKQKAPAFKGKYKQNEQGNPYYHTNSAMKIGGVLAGLSALETVVYLSTDKIMTKASSSIAKSLEAAGESIPAMKKNNKKAILLSGAIGLATHLGCAAFIDYKRNQKAKEAANYVKQVGTKEALLNNNKISLSHKNRPYRESNEGAKYGAWLGAGAALVSAALTMPRAMKDLNKAAELMSKGATKELTNTIKSASKTGMIVGTIVGVSINALGGWLLGMWSDNIANNDARKHA